MSDQALQQFRELIANNDRITIAVGRNPNVDTMGAALALYLSLSQQGKTVSVVCPTDPIVAISSLVGIDKVKRSFEDDGNTLVVSFPYTGKNIEKASYTEENGYLNIIVKAGEDGLSFTERDVKFRKEGGAPTVLIVVGTPRLSDLGELFNPETLKNTTIVNIDNKQDNQNFGDIMLLNQTASSASEHVAQLFVSLQYPMDTDIAQNLFSGISVATDNFQKPTTTPQAFELAGVLLRKGAVRPQTRVQESGSQRSFYNQTQPQPRSMGGQPRQQQQPQAPRHQQQPMQQRSNQPFGSRPAQQPRPQVSQQPAGQSAPLESQAGSPLGSVQQSQADVKPWEEAPAQEAVRQETPEEAPPDWLMPKVYKGSSEL